jgi:hypothetical protein
LQADDDGFDLGEDNRVSSLYIKDGALRFEMSAVLRPGRFLGSHYLAFTVPIRTFIVTLDRVTEGIKAARKVKRAADALKHADHRQRRRMQNSTQLALPTKGSDHKPPNGKTVPKAKAKSFVSRFVDGYLQAERDETRKERLTTAIRDFFGRQKS